MRNIIKPAICCIGYNRPESMRRLLTSVVGACYDDNDIPLIISIDESSESDKVEAVAKGFDWNYGEKTILRYPKRLGLKEHCLRCGDLAFKYGAVIFLEDDVVVAPGYYRYTKAAIDYYKDQPDVFCISLYYDNWISPFSIDFKPAYKGYDTFLAIFEESHGQCWIENGWKEFREWLKENPDTTKKYDRDVIPRAYNWNPETSWSRFMSFFISEKRKFYVLPYHSYATNMAEVGVHSAVTSDVCQTVLSENEMSNFRFARFEDAVLYDSFAERIDRFVDSVAGIDISRICLDLNGYKYDWEGYDYLLSSKDLPYKVISQFGINMEPIENNIRYKVPGNAIRLYKVPSDYKSEKDISSIIPYKIPKQRMTHIYLKAPLTALLYVAWIKIVNRLKKEFRVRI